MRILRFLKVSNATCLSLRDVSASCLSTRALLFTVNGRSASAMSYTFEFYTLSPPLSTFLFQFIRPKRLSPESHDSQSA